MRIRWRASRATSAPPSAAPHIGISPSKLVIDPGLASAAQGAERAHPGRLSALAAIDLPIMAALAQEFSGS